MRYLILTIVLLVAAPLAADEVDDVIAAYWSAIDDEDARALRRLAHDDSKHRRLADYLEGYVAYMKRIRSAYPDASQFKFGYSDPAETDLYDPTIPALFKAGQLNIYPSGAEGVATLVLQTDDGLSFIDQLVLGREDGQLKILFPLETINVAGQEERFRDRMAKVVAGEPLTGLEPLVIHMEPPDASTGGKPGCARVGYTISPEGAPGEFEVLASAPTKLYGRESREAMEKWRFAPMGESVRAESSFSFTTTELSADELRAVTEACGDGEFMPATGAPDG